MTAVAKFAARVKVGVLDLSGTKAVDVEPLSSVTTINELVLDHALYLDNVEPLKKLTSMKRLILTDCPKVSLEEIRKLQAALPTCSVHFDLRPYPPRVFELGEKEQQQLKWMQEMERSKR